MLFFGTAVKDNFSVEKRSEYNKNEADVAA